MFYHISKRDLGKKVVLEPRVPISSLISKEGNIPRVCVSKTLRGCLCSINGGGNLTVSAILQEFNECDYLNSLEPKPITKFEAITIYGTLEEPYIPPDASDFRENEEYWFLKQTCFKRIGYLDIENLKQGILKITDIKNGFEGEYNLFKENIRF